jgi:AAA ATPase domain
VQALRIRNFRSLLDTGRVEIKPVTALVGSNSSGKSTFLRTLPLLRQSVETATSSPVLWFGRYVDFGSIAEAESAATPGSGVTFEFSLELDPRYLVNRTSTIRRPDTASLPVTAAITIKNQGQEGNADIVSCTLDLDDLSIKIEFHKGEVRKFTVGSYDATSNGPELEVVPGALIPTLRVKPSGGESALADISPIGAWYRFRKLCPAEVTKAVNQLVHQNTGNERVQEAALGLRIGTAADMLHQLQELRLGPKWKANVSKWTTRSTAFVHLRERIVANATAELLTGADVTLSETASSVLYMGPFRAAAQRYYRVQDLAISEVDFRGENLAMFLRSLRDDERVSFSAFVHDHFGIEVRANDSPGHVGIFLRESVDSLLVNLADTGFGYSQLLPIVAQLWSSFSTPRRRRTPVLQNATIVAAEQPELHLHPAHQARLADLYVGAVAASRAKGRPIRVVLETHSESIINRLGELVRLGTIPAEDVQILVFDKEPTSQTSSIQTATFSQDGELLNWPFGFFLPSQA